jgi:hypothetical protein
LQSTDEEAVACRGGGELASPVHPETNVAASRLNSTPRKWVLATGEAYRKRCGEERVA